MGSGKGGPGGETGLQGEVCLELSFRSPRFERRALAVTLCQYAVPCTTAVANSSSLEELRVRVEYSSLNQNSYTAVSNRCIPDYRLLRAASARRSAALSLPPGASSGRLRG